MRYLIAALVLLPVALAVGGHNGATLLGVAFAVAAIIRTIFGRTQAAEDQPERIHP